MPKLFGVPHIHNMSTLLKRSQQQNRSIGADTNCSTLAQKDEIIIMQPEGDTGVKKSHWSSYIK